MQITHIYHSGFLVELEQHVLIFDWYDGDLPKFDTRKSLYVFVSHAHLDHYDRGIWKLRSTCPQVFYILDEGVQALEPVLLADPAPNVVLVEPLRRYRLNDVEVTTYQSTDQGVSFLVRVEGRTLFHAGDLNAWCFPDDTEETNQRELEDFENAVDRFSGTHFDVAFIPLDPRQGDFAPLAICYFLLTMDVDAVFPMHYWDSADKAAAYLDDKDLVEFRDRIHMEETCLIG